MGVAFVFGAVIGLMIAYYAAKEFEAIAAMKGFVDKKYFWWSFLMPPFGMLMVVALPDRAFAQNRNPQAASDQPDDLPEL